MKKFIFVLGVFILLSTSMVMAQHIDGRTIEGTWQDRKGYQFKIFNGEYGKWQSYSVRDIIREKGKTTIVILVMPEFYNLYLTFNDDNPNYFVMNGNKPNHSGPDKTPIRVAKDWVRVK